MSQSRVEPFQQALTDLRERLRDGRLSPGARITAKDVAEALRLSATPVREALSRLAGEGLLEERRGDGFFVRSLTALDIADLYRMSHSILALAQATDRQPHRDLTAAALGQDDDPVRSVERLFSAWAAESSSRVLMENHRILSLKLAPVRRLENRLLADLQQEAIELLALAEADRRADRAAALERFHDRRLILAEDLAQLLDPDGSMQV